MRFSKVTSVSCSPDQVSKAWKDGLTQVQIAQLEALPLYQPTGSDKERRGSLGTRAYEDAKHMSGGFLAMLKPFWADLPFFKDIPQWNDYIEELPQFQKWVTEDCEPYMRALGERYVRSAKKGDDKDELHNSPVNGRLATHTKDGRLDVIDDGTLLKLFDSSDSTDWPQVVLTSSHAMARDEKDVADIMSSFHRLISSSGEGKTLSLLRYPEEGIGKSNGDKVVMAAAIDAAENAWINGANLIQRCTRVRHMQRGFSELAQKNAPDLFPDDYLIDMSPAAVRLGRQILASLIEEKDYINLEVTERSDIINGAWGHLRPDAAEVAKHFTLVGYSKGGNVVTDAVRYVTYQLAHLPLSKSGEERPLTDKDIAEVVQNIQLLSVAVARHEVPLNQTEKKYGMRRTNVVNENDIIAGPFNLDQYEREVSWDEQGNPKCRDLIIPVDGPEGKGSHDPVEAMGEMDDFGRLVEGYLTQNEMVKDRLAHMFAKLHERSEAVQSVEHEGCVGEIGTQRSA